MKKFLLLLFLILESTLNNVLCNDSKDRDKINHNFEKVVELDEINFKDFLSKNKNVLVVFYDYSELSRQIINNLEFVAKELDNRKSNGKIAVLNSVANRNIADNYILNKFPKILLFNGSASDYLEYPNHLSGKEQHSMISIMVSRDNPVYFSFDGTKYDKIDEAINEFDLEGKIYSSSIPVVVYYGKKDTKRTKIILESLEFMRENGVSVKAYIIYVKYKSDIGLHIYRLPQPNRDNTMETNPKELYKANMRIFGVLEWTRDIIRVFIESAIRPYVSFKGNELMYVDKTTNSLITYLKGSSEKDMYGNLNVEFLSHEKMQKLINIAKENFYPEDPDKDLAVGLILPGLEALAESKTGFYRNEHIDNGSYLLKRRKTVFDLENSGTTNKYIIPEQAIINCDKFSDILTDIQNNKYPIFYKSKILSNKEYSSNIDEYFMEPYRPLELNSNTLREYLYYNNHKTENTAFLLMFYAELSIKSKKMTDMFKELTEYVSKNLNSQTNSRIIISLFDVENNDIPNEFKVEKIPFIYYLPFGNDKVKNSIVYAEHQSLEIFKGYLEDRIAFQENKMKDSEDKDSDSKIRDEL
ncbi:hypothetical protein FG386_001012 [Cryptosporidium ryanae]|uniref:uncharacterized protein n=1 Tax=Cryptosporidium ryanae TaxID=515981 RepID=UPI00351A324D|nr:hypothetical protein FG386_001012 [Cryptosporidium ryanae]